MEVVTMHPSHHSPMDPSYLGQAPNMYLTGLGGQQRQQQQQQQQQDSPRHPGTPSGHTNDYADDTMDSPAFNWDEFAGNNFENQARLLEQHGQSHHTTMLNLQMRNMQYPASATSVGFQVEPGMLSASSVVSGTSPMEYSLSASASPAPEMLPDFTSPLNQASFDPEVQTQALHARHSLTQAPQHRHMKSTPSPSRSQTSPELSRRKSAPTKGSTTSSRVNKSPKTAQSSAATGARSAHSAIERRYRENINNKIGELHKVLCTAGPPIFSDQEMESGGYPYSRMPRADDDDCSVESGPSATQAVLPAKKADVLAGAISYVKRSEREKKLLMEQLGSVTAQLQHLEAVMNGRSTSLG